MVPYDLRTDYALDIAMCISVTYGINFPTILCLDKAVIYSLHNQGTKSWGSLESTVKNSESIVEL